MSLDSIGPAPCAGTLAVDSISPGDQVDLAAYAPIGFNGVRGLQLVSAAGATATIRVRYASRWRVTLPGDTALDAEGYSALTLSVGESVGPLQIVAVRSTGSTAGSVWRLFP